MFGLHSEWMVDGVDSLLSELDRMDELLISCFQARPQGDNQPCSMHVPRGGHCFLPPLLRIFLPSGAVSCLGDI